MPRQQQTFRFGESSIPVEVFTPEALGRHPALVVLHGSGGYRDLSALALLMTAYGYCVFAPHYFAATQTSWASPAEIKEHAVSWSQAIAASIDLVARHPAVDAQRIALVGFSLGGYLAVGVAARDARIAAVVEFFGGLPEPLAEDVRRLPPTLILHGEADRVVPVAEAHRLRRFCEERGVCVEVETFPGAGHFFSPPVMQQAALRALDFLERHLRRAA
jgi:carboxymethylenebutenolidase